METRVYICIHRYKYKQNPQSSSLDQKHKFSGFIFSFISSLLWLLHHDIHAQYRGIHGYIIVFMHINGIDCYIIIFMHIILVLSVTS